MIIIITALCLISLARAEEKKGGRIEPKLVYEKRFDFEIEQGKIGDDDSIFLTILTKDNRVLFLNKVGQIKKAIKTNKHDNVSLTNDGRYVVVQSCSGNWWNKDVKKNWRVYDCSGKLLIKGEYTEPYASVIQIFKNPIRIILHRCTVERVVDIQFFDDSGHLLNAYAIDNLIADIGGGSTSHTWVFTQVDNLAGKCITGAITSVNQNLNENDKAWAVVFDTDGKIIWKKNLRHYNIENIAISPDGKYIVYATEPALKQYLVLIDRTTEFTWEYELEQNIWKDRPFLSLNPKFTPDSKWFYYFSHFNNFYLFNVEKIINSSHNTSHVKWYGPTSEIIIDAVISNKEPLCAGIVFDNNEIALLTSNGEELFKILEPNTIIDLKINSADKKLHVLTGNSLKTYSW